MTTEIRKGTWSDLSPQSIPLHDRKYAIETKVDEPINKQLITTLESYYLSRFEDYWDNRPTEEEKIQARRDRWFQALCLNAHTVTQH